MKSPDLGSSRSADPAHDVGDVIRVLTLNLGHGRGDHGHQLLQGRETIEVNLDQVAEEIRRIDPDVVALQEADRSSSWSGGFDHVGYLADRTGLPYRFSGSHSRSLIFDYGTALLSKHPLIDSRSITFPPSFPTFTKGYVMSDLAWAAKDDGDARIRIASIHMDFSRASVRREQAEQLIEEFFKADTPVLLLGDFNADWNAEDSVVRLLVRELDLRVHRAGTGQATYSKNDRRLDWILISDDLAFVQHQVEEESVSDHRIVWADIERTPKDGIGSSVEVPTPR